MMDLPVHFLLEGPWRVGNIVLWYDPVGRCRLCLAYNVFWPEFSILEYIMDSYSFSEVRSMVFRLELSAEGTWVARSIAAFSLTGLLRILNLGCGVRKSLS